MEKDHVSPVFRVDDRALARVGLPAVVGFFQHQRANSPQELEADKTLILYGSDKTVDLHGGWCDASGDISKILFALWPMPMLCRPSRYRWLHGLW